MYMDFNYTGSDVMDAVTLPILMMQSQTAVDSMAWVVEIGETETEQRKQMVSAFILGLLALIPIAAKSSAASANWCRSEASSRSSARPGRWPRVYIASSTALRRPVDHPFLQTRLDALHDVGKVTDAAKGTRAMKDGDITKMAKSVEPWDG